MVKLTVLRPDPGFVPLVFVEMAMALPPKTLPPDRLYRKQWKPGLSALSLSLKVRLWKIESVPWFRRLLLRLDQCDQAGELDLPLVWESTGKCPIRSDPARFQRGQAGRAFEGNPEQSRTEEFIPNQFPPLFLSRLTAVHYNSNPSAKMGASVGSP